MEKILFKLFALGCVASVSTAVCHGQNVTQGGITYKLSRLGVPDGELAARISHVSEEVKGRVVTPERLDTLYKFSAGASHPIVVGIERGAFQGNKSITSIELPATLTEFPDSVFKDCTALTSVKFDGMSGTMPVACFYGCTSLESVTIPAGVKETGNQSFAYCSSLKDVEFPANLELIRNMSFAYCGELTSLQLPDSLWGIYPYAFENCTGLTEVNIPDNVAYLSGFNGCDNLSKVNFGEGFRLHTLGTAAFAYCKSLDRERLEVPSTVVNIYPHSFAGWTKLKEVVLPESAGYVSGFDWCSNLESINLDNVKVLFPDAFRGCTKLFGATIDVPDNITDLYPGCFGNLPDVTKVNLHDGMSCISGFDYCTGLTEIDIPQSVEYIFYDAFRGCTGLTSITVPSSVGALGANAFKDCTSLKSVTIEDNANELSLIAGFELEDVMHMPKARQLFPDSPVEYLYLGRDLMKDGRYLDKTLGEEYDNYPLEGLTTLKTLEIGASVTTLGALDGAANLALETIKSLPSVPPVANEFSAEQYRDVTLWTLYDDFSTSPYASDPVWSKFGNVKFDAAVDDVAADGDVVAVRYYNLQGMEVAEPTDGEVYVVKQISSDGSATVKKQAF